MGWLSSFLGLEPKKSASSGKAKKWAARRSHHVYVVELDHEVLKERKFMAANPQYRKGMNCFYVGMTGLSPEARFKNHQDGHKSNKYAHKYGKRLCPREYAKYNPMTYEQAQKREVQLAESFRAKGHAVWQK